MRPETVKSQAELIVAKPRAFAGRRSRSGGAVSTVAVIAIFISNIPEGLSSAAGMKNAGRSTLYIFGVGGGIAAISAAICPPCVAPSCPRWAARRFRSRNWPTSN